MPKIISLLDNGIAFVDDGLGNIVVIQLGENDTLQTIKTKFTSSTNKFRRGAYAKFIDLEW